MKIKSKFYKIYFAVIIIFVIALIVGLGVLYFWLNSYEQSQPTTIVNKIISDYLEAGKIEELQDDYKLEISSYETVDNLKAVLSEYVGDDKELSVAHNSIKPDDIDEAYIIKSGDDKILNVYLKKKAVGSGYNVSYLEVSKNLYKTIEITVPKGIKVTINGIELADEDRTDNELPTLPSKIDVSTLTPTQTASITNMLSETADVKAYDGKTELEVKVSGNTYKITKPVDKEVAASVQDIAKKAAVAYTAYMQKDGSIGTLATYCDTTCDFYRNAASSLVIFVKDHNGYQDKNFVIGDVTAYSDSVYSCQISYDHVLLLGSSTYSDPFNKVIFVTKSGSTYKVIDMQNVETSVSNTTEEETTTEE